MDVYSVDWWVQFIFSGAVFLGFLNVFARLRRLERNQDSGPNP